MKDKLIFRKICMKNIFFSLSAPKRSVERLERLTARTIRHQLRCIVNTRHQGPPVLGRYVHSEKKSSTKRGVDEESTANTIIGSMNETSDANSTSQTSSSPSSPTPRVFKPNPSKRVTSDLTQE